MQANNQTLKQTVNTFFIGHKLDKEKLRLYVLEQLTAIKKSIDTNMYGNQNQAFWNQLQDAVYANNNVPGIASIQEIKEVTKKLDYWISECVSSTQHFEFFILQKAAELSSGNQDNDYYHALMIRNDQLLAVVEVFSQIKIEIESCLTKTIPELITDPIFLSYGQKSIDKRIFEMATAYYEARMGK